MGRETVVTNAAVGVRVRARIPELYFDIMLVQDPHLSALLKFIYHRGDEPRSGTFNIRMLRKKGQPEMDGLGTIRGIHDKVDMMFKVLAHINDANLISS